MQPEVGVSWLILDNFNEILSHKEKRGGYIRPECQMNDFREVVVVCDSRDLGFQGLLLLGVTKERDLN